MVGDGYKVIRHGRTGSQEAQVPDDRDRRLPSWVSWLREPVKQQSFYMQMELHFSKYVKLLGKSDVLFSPEHPTVTEQAQRTLDWAVGEKLKSGESGVINTTHLFLVIWSEEDSAGHKILASLGSDSDKTNELAKSANEDVAMSYR